MARYVGRRLGGTVLSLIAPGSGQWLLGRTRRSVGFLVAMIVAMLLVPFLGPALLLAAMLLRLAAAIDPLLGRVDPPPLTRGLTGAIVYLMLGVGFVVAVRIVYMEGFRIPSGGMAPTLLPEDRFLARRFGLPPATGEVVVYEALDAGSGDHVQRVVARAGDVVSIRDGLLTVGGQMVTDGAGMPCKVPTDDGEAQATCHAEAIGDQRYQIALGGEPGAGDYPGADGCHPTMESTEDGCRVPDGHLFMLGDNRNDSLDSRQFGPVPEDRVKGVVLFVWYSADGFRFDRALR